MIVSASGETLYFDGGAGRNTLDYSESVVAQVDLGAGTATQFAEGVSNFQDVFGSPGNDSLLGDGQNNLLVGGDGDDIIDGRGGNDSLFGQAGNDILTGGFGNDLLVGGSGADQLFGSAGSDLLIADLVSNFQQPDSIRCGFDCPRQSRSSDGGMDIQSKLHQSCESVDSGYRIPQFDSA